MAQNNYEELEQYDYLDGEYLGKVIDRYSPLIGSFLVNFSILEYELNLAIAEIMSQRCHETGFVIIERLSMSNKIELFYKLYLRLESDTGKKNKKILDKIREQLEVLNSFRNDTVHANWQSLAKDGFVRTKIAVDSQEGYVKFKKVKITPKIIRQKIKEIDSLLNKIDEYQEKALNF